MHTIYCEGLKVQIVELTGRIVESFHEYLKYGRFAKYINKALDVITRKP